MANVQEFPAIFLTGQPGCGKTTIIQKLLTSIQHQAAGFYTRELREDNVRYGFEIVTLDGKQSLLATKEAKVHFEKEQTLGTYKVNLDAIDSVAVPALLKAISTKKIALVDEIGPMEIFSRPFCDTILNLLNRADVPVLGTIVERPNEFADMVKAHPRVALITVTAQNRDSLPQTITSMLAGIIP